MALRSRPVKVFYLECDRCPEQSSQALMPVEAHLIAAGASWWMSADLKQHLCPHHAPREAPVDAPLGEQIDQGTEIDLSGL